MLFDDDCEDYIGYEIIGRKQKHRHSREIEMSDEDFSKLSNVQITGEEYQKLTQAERDELMTLLKEAMGGEQINMHLFCTEQIRSWWETKIASGDDRGNVMAIQLLMSNVLMGIIRTALSDPRKDFERKCSVILNILSGDTRVIIKDAPLDEDDMEAPTNEDTNGKTFH